MAVVALVGDHLGYAATGREHRFDLSAAVTNVSTHFVSPALASCTATPTDRARLHVDHVLGPVGQVRPAVLIFVIFHLRDLRVRVLRMRPMYRTRFLGHKFVLRGVA